MSALVLHPSLWLFAGALAVGLVGRRRIPAPLVGTAFAIPALLVLLRLSPVEHQTVLAGFRLTWFRADDLSLLFALVFTIVILLGLLYGAHRMQAAETAIALIYGGAALATIMAGDWITFFVFWELMGLAAAGLVWQGLTRQARRAGMRYLLVHGAGGAVLFLGIALHLAGGGAAVVGPLAAGLPPFWLVLAAVALNAAIPPLHAWLTDSYPEASTAGAVFLSALTTKTAVYALLRVFPGTAILVPIGVGMALYGVVFAIIENDIRRLLSYHIVSQVGYMVAAVGLGTPLALNGAASHAYSHILYKALLFMGAGAVIEATGRRRLSDLGGIAGRMRIACLLYLVGAAAISGWPALNGFISKSMIVSAAMDEHLLWTELLLVLASVGTFLSVGLKLPWFAFFAEREGEIETRRLPVNLLAAMGIAGGLCLLYGLYPTLLYVRLPYGATYEPFTLDHFSSTGQLLVGTAFLFLLVLGRMRPKPHLTLDADWLYRRPLRRAGATLVAGMRFAHPRAMAVRASVVGGLETAAIRIATGRPHPRAGDFAFRSSIGWTVVLAAVVVVTLLLLLTPR